MGEKSVLIESLDGLARALLEALLNSFWQGLVIAALVWLMLRLTRSASATTRHAVWMVCLLTIGVLPLTGLVGWERSSTAGPAVGEGPAAEPRPVDRPAADQFELGQTIARIKPQVGRVEVSLNPARLSVAQIDETNKVVTLLESSKVAPVGPARTAGLPVELDRKEPVGSWYLTMTGLFKGPVPMVLIGIWLVVAGLMLGRLALSYVALFGLRRRFEDVAAEERERVDRLRALIGIKRRVRVYTADRVSAPMTIGSVRPVIVLPPELSRSLSVTEYESVIAHELAHIKRWDYLTNLLQRTVEACLCFNPAVWLIGKQLAIERELACDDWAVKTCEPRRYASCLTKLVELLSESKPLAAAAGILFGKHVITRRVEMILNRDRNATTAVSKPALVYSIGLALLIVSVCCLISPVIAVPLTQKAAAAQPAGKKGKATTVTAAKSQEPAPVPDQPTPPPAAPSAPLPPDFDEIELPEPPAPPELAEVDPDDEWLTPPPAPLARTLATTQNWGSGFGVGFGLGMAQGQGAAPLAQQPLQPTRPLVTPRAAVIAGLDQEEKSKTPAIPESELLGVLTDIVKKDADPAVRQEALHGIYRMRSDAAINTLIQLYDGSTDVKVKGEILGYLLRRNGDNTKAIAKLTSVAKSDPNEELRNRALRSLGSIRTDEGANNLIQIYDGLQDSKAKQTVIRYLAYTKSRKAIDKLIQIAKTDSDPAIRQAAIRGLYGLDNQIYLEMLEKSRPKISLLENNLKLFDMDKFRGELFDSKKLQELQEKMKIEIPKMDLDLSPEIREKLEQLREIRPRPKDNK